MCFVCHDFASVHCCLVVTCWEMADLLALVCDVYCDFVTFPFGILGKVWYSIVSIPDPCCLSYFDKINLGGGGSISYNSRGQRLYFPSKIVFFFSEYLFVFENSVDKAFHLSKVRSQLQHFVRKLIKNIIMQINFGNIC